MTVQLVRIDWQGRDVSGVTGSFTFDDIENVSIKKDSKAKSSHATIILKNVYDRFRTGFNQPFTKYNQNINQLRFQEGDSVKIYGAEISSFRDIDTSSGSSDLLMTGEIAEVSVKGAASGAKITLKVIDKTYIILNRIHPGIYTSTSAMNAPEIVQDVVRSTTDNVESDVLSFDSNGNLVSNGVYGADARLVSAGTTSHPGFIEDTRIDGSVFPDITMASAAKTAYDWIRDLSSLDSTNDFAGSDDADAPTQDRNMLFYIDEQARFHWYYPRDALSTTLNGAISNSVTTITLTDASNFPSQGSVFIGTERIDYTGKSGNDLTGCTRGANNTDAASHSNGDTVRNVIVITEGSTSQGYTLIDFNLTKKTFDIINFVIFNCGADMKGNGIRSYWFDRATKSKTLKDTFKSYNEIASKLFQEEIDVGNLTLDNTTTSAFFFKGNRYKVNGSYNKTTSWGATVTSDDNYNTTFRTECIKRGKTKAQMLTANRGSPRWKGTMQFKFHRFTPGELFEFTSTRGGLNKQSLRIKTVIYNLTKNSAFVTLMVEEDEDKLTP